MTDATVPELLRLHRRRRRLTQKQAADAAGMHLTSYRHVEAGRVSPRVAALVSLAALFGVSPRDLVPQSIPEPEHPPCDESRSSVRLIS